MDCKRCGSQSSISSRYCVLCGDGFDSIDNDKNSLSFIKKYVYEYKFLVAGIFLIIAFGFYKRVGVNNNLAISKESTVSSNENSLREFYKILKKGADPFEYRVQHVLVATEAEAWAIIFKIQSGADIGNIAKQQSLDTGSKNNGGVLDWESPSSFVSNFSNAMKKLKKGDYSQSPVQTQFGFHIIKLIDVREAQFPKFEELKNTLKGDPLNDYLTGKGVYLAVCAACHDVGAAGASKVGDRSKWSYLISDRYDKLHQSAINGKGAMPSRKSWPHYSVNHIYKAFDYMILISK